MSFYLANLTPRSVVRPMLLIILCALILLALPIASATPARWSTPA
jgi:hypothetical protein